MSKMYTTGEIAKLCDITVRTVQYYDNRGILTPSEISEGGRRLYSQSDFEKLEIICELRKLGLSINVISKIFQEENNAKVIETLLDTHAKQLQSEIDEKQSSLDKINRILKESESFENFNIKNSGDVVNSMEKRKKLKKVYAIMLCLGIVADILEVASIVLWTVKGIWLPFAILMPTAFILAFITVKIYYKSTAYICPDCHATFKPEFKEFFFANHTFKTRKLTCTNCGKKSFCIEIYDEKEKEKQITYKKLCTF